MNILKFNPTKDLPRCDICEGVAQSIAFKYTKSHTYELGKVLCEVQFVCGALHTTEYQQDHKVAPPDKRLSVYGSREEWKNEEQCGESTRVARELRKQINDQLKANNDPETSY